MKIKTRKPLFLATALLIFGTITAQAQSNIDYGQMPVLVKNAELKGDMALANNIAKDYIDNYLFKQKIEVLFTKGNLEFIGQHLVNTQSKAFKLFLKKKGKVNSILGENKVEYAVRPLIAAEYIPTDESIKERKSDWNKIEKIVTNEFGPLGKEVIQGRRMMYYSKVKDWVNFGKYYVLYFEKALKRPEYIINQPSWYVFENVNDPIVLKFACDVVMKYAMEEWYQTDANAYDTYAQLLYKNGRTAQAIEWEEKALKLGKGVEYYEKQSTEALEKMRKNLPTWIITTNN